VTSERESGGPVGVLMLAKGLGRGGTERLLAGTVRLLDPARFRVEVAYLLPWKDALVGEIEAAGVPVHCLDGPRPTSVAWLARLRRLVGDHDIDLVHTHMPAPAVAARVALPGRRPAFVHTEHNLWDRYRPLTRWANRATYGRNAAVVAVSAAVADSVRARRPVPEVVVHGVDAPDAPDAPAPEPPDPAAARRRLGIDGAGPVIGTVGNFTAKKDHAGLVRAFARLAAGDPGAVLVLVGAGPLEDDLRAQVDAVGLAGRVVFAGSRGDVPDLLAAFDVFVLSSRYEGLPIALLEAMAAGRACVATDVGGVPEVVTDGVDGVLVPPGDPDALAAALAAVAGDADRRATLGAGAEQRAADFRLDAAVACLAAVYDRALGRRPDPAPAPEPAR
jgi:glycosyltransferase involved in cell wall biosynthesis